MYYVRDDGRSCPECGVGFVFVKERALNYATSKTTTDYFCPAGHEFMEHGKYEVRRNERVRKTQFESTKNIRRPGEQRGST